MENTKNINLEKPALSNTFGELLEALNLNSDKLDELPLPIGYGKNSQMEYLKLSNGTVVMWGRLAHGQNYPCNETGAGGDYYTSKLITVNFPIPLVNANPTVLPNVHGEVYSDVFFLQRSVSYTNITGFYYCRYNDTTAKNNKNLNLLVIGKWK